MKKILVTGFDPFGGETINPAWETVKLLPGQIGDKMIDRLMIPTVYGKAGAKVIERIEEAGPCIVLMVGQAGGRKNVTPEAIAINLRDARIDDNEGKRPWNEKVCEDGPAAYFETVGAHDIVTRLKEEGYPVELSYSAGTFVCNDVFYAVSHYCAGRGIRCEFVHVPFLPEQAKDKYPSLTQDELLRTITRLIEIM